MIKKNKIPWLDKILFDNLRPWLDENLEHDKFIDMLYELDPAEPIIENYSLNFYRSFNPITDYYKKYIDTKGANFIHEVEAKIDDQEHDISKTYSLKNLIRRIDYYLEKISETIRAKSYGLNYIDPEKTSLELDEQFKTEVWVIYYALYTLIKVRMELAEIHSQIFPDDIRKYDETDVFLRILKQTIPPKFFIHKIKNIDIKAPKKKIYVLEDRPKDTPFKIVSTNSFRYKKYTHQHVNLTNVCDSLKNNRFISKSTKTTDFKKVFSGNEITEPIVWIGSPSDLAYFIKQIHNNLKLVEDIKQKQWDVALKCFVKEDGSQFDRLIRKYKKTVEGGDLIDKAVDLMK